MESINQRVFRMLGGRHGVQKDLADFLGISDRTINKWKSRGSAIDSEFIPGIADYLGVTDTFLLRGSDESFSSEELKLIGLFRSLSEQGKSEVLNFVQYTFQNFGNESIRKQLKEMEKELTEEEKMG
jgi:transcriptional regulator with XRE-family HTH domain